MARIGFIGLGNMGLPMACNLVRAGHVVRGLDLAKDAMEALREAGGRAAADVAGAVGDAEIVLTMLPEGRHVRRVYLEAPGILDAAPKGALLIDCSTIDVETARGVAKSAADRGFPMLDAPVSGGVTGAAGASLTFMVGGDDASFARAQPILGSMGKAVIHAGPSGTGQAAKICNNLILGVSMIAVAEAFALAGRLGLDAQRLFDISSKSSGQCWSMTSYCPVAGPVPASPANHGYRPGFTAAMMLKDLRLAQQAAQSVGLPTPVASEACQLYTLFARSGNEGLDFSAIIKMMAQEIG